jgi:hypothetical protein
MPPFRDPFGRLLTRPEDLPRAEQIACLRRATGALLAATMPELQWLGRVFSRRTTQGGDLEAALGIRGRPGQRAAESLAHQARCDGALLRLSSLAGSDARALRILRGQEGAPIEAVDALAELRELRAPVSRAAFARARLRSRASS